MPLPPTPHPRTTSHTHANHAATCNNHRLLIRLFPSKRVLVPSWAILEVEPTLSQPHMAILAKSFSQIQQRITGHILNPASTTPLFLLIWMSKGGASFCTGAIVDDRYSEHKTHQHDPFTKARGTLIWPTATTITMTWEPPMASDVFLAFLGQPSMLES